MIIELETLQCATDGDVQESKFESFRYHYEICRHLRYYKFKHGNRVETFCHKYCNDSFALSKSLQELSSCEMGDRMATIAMGRKWGGAAVAWATIMLPLFS